MLLEWLMGGLQMFDEKCSVCSEKLRYEDATFYKLNGARPDLAKQIYICPKCKASIDEFIIRKQGVIYD
jgi:hypothetical protein